MKCLFLDLASHDALLACVAEHKTIAHTSVHARIGDDELLPMIEQTLKEAGWSYRDLDQVACVVGPGGFTSLRVAVAFANTLADQLDIPAASVHLSDLYFARLRDTTDETYWLHSTKKDQLFVCGEEWKEPTLIHVDELATFNPSLWCGELIDEHRGVIDADPLGLLPITDVLPAFLQKQDYQRKLLVPWYGRGW